MKVFKKEIERSSRPHTEKQGPQSVQLKIISLVCWSSALSGSPGSSDSSGSSGEIIYNEILKCLRTLCEKVVMGRLGELLSELE